MSGSENVIQPPTAAANSAASATALGASANARAHGDDDQSSTVSVMCPAGFTASSMQGHSPSRAVYARVTYRRKL